MNDFRLHLAPDAPWLWLVLASAAALVLAGWVYRFARPPLPPSLRTLLAVLRAAALLALLWLLAQPVFERALMGGGQRVLLLVDRSRSMDLAAAAGAPPRRQSASMALERLRAGLRGRAVTDVRGFAADDDSAGGRDATALGDALQRVARQAAERRPDAVVVISDGAVNAGADPVAAARALGVPVHVVPVGRDLAPDRAVAEVEASPQARVGEPTTVRVRVRSTEERGTPLLVRVLEDAGERARATLLAPGAGAEATAELRVTPTRPGLAVWTARVDSIAADVSPLNDARAVAVEVRPGRLGVLIVSGGLQWDLAFMRRALVRDSGLTVSTRVRDGAGWRALGGGAGGAPEADDLRGVAVVVMDGVSPAEVSPRFDQALARFARSGGGLLLIGGEAPGLTRFARGALVDELALDGPGAGGRTAAPRLEAAGAEVLDWDEDPARGAEAWRRAAPLSDVLPLRAGAGDRVLVAADGGGEPLLLARRAGRGPVMMINGGALWRWSLSGTDPLQASRGARLWPRVIRWLSEPVQAEPLRVRAERALTPAGEPVRLFATLQDAAFTPVAGATVTGEARSAGGEAVALVFEPREAGSYVATLPAPAAGRWEVMVRARRDARALADARADFAVDRWSLEALGTQPDSAGLAQVAAASGGRVLDATASGPLDLRSLARPRTSSTRLWQSPWMFAVVVGLLGLEWMLRRLRGLP